ncbi:MAG: hypothetical protein Q7S15_01455 [bacterium]|nr:hypothetical protein [bacterium]
MSKHQVEQLIENKIRLVNANIDRKIVEGRPYLAEARRHKFLLRELRRIKGRQRSFFQSLSFLGFF